MGKHKMFSHRVLAKKAIFPPELRSYLGFSFVRALLTQHISFFILENPS